MAFNQSNMTLYSIVYTIAANVSTIETNPYTHTTPHCGHPQYTSPWAVYPITTFNHILCYLSITSCFIAINRYYIRLDTIVGSLKWSSIFCTIFYTLSNIAWLINWHYDSFYCFWKYYITITVTEEENNSIWWISRQSAMACQTIGYSLYSLACIIRLIYCFKDSLFEISKSLQIFCITIWTASVIMIIFGVISDIFPIIPGFDSLFLILFGTSLIIYLVASFAMAMIGLFRIYRFAKFIQAANSPSKSSQTMFTIKTIDIPNTQPPNLPKPKAKPKLRIQATQKTYNSDNFQTQTQTQTQITKTTDKDKSKPRNKFKDRLTDKLKHHDHAHIVWSRDQSSRDQSSRDQSSRDLSECSQSNRTNTTTTNTADTANLTLENETRNRSKSSPRMNAAWIQAGNVAPVANTPQMSIVSTSGGSDVDDSARDVGDHGSDNARGTENKSNSQSKSKSKSQNKRKSVVSGGTKRVAIADESNSKNKSNSKRIDFSSFDDEFNHTVRELYKVIKRFTVLFSISLFSTVVLFIVVFMLFAIFFVIDSSVLGWYIMWYCYRTLIMIDCNVNAICLLLYNDAASNIYNKYCIFCDKNVTKCWFYQCFKRCDC